MRILQVVPHYVPAFCFGGPLRVAHSLGKALVYQGHQVTVCTTNIADQTSDIDVAVDTPVIVDGITVYYEPTHLSRYWGFSPQLWRRVRKEVTTADVAFVHFHYQFANWAGAYLARQSTTPYVIFSHGSFNRWGIERKSSWKKKSYLGILERQNINQALFVAFNSPEEKDLSRYGERGLVIPSGIDPHDFTGIPPAGSWRAEHPNTLGKVCFLYLGRLNPTQKGLDLLIPAFSRLASQRDDVHLVLAGPDERGGESKVREMVRNLNLDERVTLTGMVTGAEKLSILNDCDAFVLASPSEGTSIALLEAMYMGLPVVVTDRVGLSTRIAREDCGLVVSRDEEELFGAMMKLLASDERERMGKKAHDLVKSEFTWDSIALDFMSQLRRRLA